jgi:TfoX/Sxy family transcriptional regulator of competence genes
VTRTWQQHLDRIGELEGLLRFPLTRRQMFGGAMLYADGKPITSLSGVGIGIKSTGPDHAALLAIDGTRRLQYGPDQPESKSYVLVPDDLVGDDDRLAHWLNLAADQAARSPTKSRRVKPPAAGSPAGR